MSLEQNSAPSGSNSSTGWAAATTSEPANSAPDNSPTTESNPTSSTPPQNPLTTASTTTEPGDETPPAPSSNPLAEGLDAGEKPAAEGEPAAKEGEGEAAPAFDFASLQLPEGVVLREQDTSAFNDLAKKHGLSAEAQKDLVAMQVAIMGEMAASGQEALAAEEQAFTALQQRWADEIKNDPELGGKNLEQTWARVGTAIDMLAGDKKDETGKVLSKGYKSELVQAIQLGGLANHPALLRYFHDVAGLLSEGAPLASGNPAGGQPLNAQGLFPSMKNA